MTIDGDQSTTRVWAGLVTDVPTPAGGSAADKVADSLRRLAEESGWGDLIVGAGTVGRRPEPEP